VWVDPEEIANLADHLALSAEQFTRRFVRRTWEGRLALIDKANRDCVFWEDGCTVYPARPRQCRTFPFWSENLDLPESWGRAARRCPGIDRGPRYDAVEIDRLASGEGETGRRK
jgi:Fe-S-cluster containining protein